MSDADSSDDEHQTPDEAHSQRAPLEAEVQGKLGEKLREAYSDVMNEPVPDRFLDLLAQLDAKSSKGRDAE